MAKDVQLMGFLGRLFRYFLGRAQPADGRAPVVVPPKTPPRESPPASSLPPEVAQPQVDPAFAPAPISTATAVAIAPAQDPYFSADAGTKPEPQAIPAPPPKTNALDASAFLPITRQEIKAEAQGKNLFANAWFGRRDLIPPVEDPRTVLIDRALVSHGLLTPEQLVEIHEVGAQADRHRAIRSTIEQKAAEQGETAVIADREARARLKAQKKAEAAERKRLRNEAIAHRKATDINFLGRGVSGRLQDRQSNVEALQAACLPILHTPADLAQALELSIPRLRWLAFHSEVATRIHYVSFTVPKKSGGTRVLSAPHRNLATAQRWIFKEIVAKLPVEEPAHGFVPGRSILSNASLHTNRAVVVNLDLKNFFPSIGFPRIRHLFQRVGYSPAVATILALLCTECPRRPVKYDGKPYFVATGPRGLPQGACTSPALSNQIARRLDRRLRGLAERLELTYTRYADDITFSGEKGLEAKVGYLMARVRHITQDEGFVVNESKSRVLGRNTAQTVTGLVVNDRPGVPRDEIRRIRAILHRARTEGLATQNRHGHPNFLAWLQGKIAYISMSRPEVGQRMQDELAALLQERSS